LLRLCSFLDRCLTLSLDDLLSPVAKMEASPQKPVPPTPEESMRKGVVENAFATIPAEREVSHTGLPILIQPKMEDTVTAIQHAIAIPPQIEEKRPIPASFIPPPPPPTIANGKTSHENSSFSQSVKLLAKDLPPVKYEEVPSKGMNGHFQPKVDYDGKNVQFKHPVRFSREGKGRPHRCNKCGAGFKTTSTLRRHVKRSACQKGEDSDEEGAPQEMKLAYPDHDYDVNNQDDDRDDDDDSILNDLDCVDDFVKECGEDELIIVEEQEEDSVEKDMEDIVNTTLQNGRLKVEEARVKLEPATTKPPRKKRKTKAKQPVMEEGGANEIVIEVKSLPFKCSECPKSFVNSSLLRLHARVHTGERPHKCDECGRTFRLSHHLADHKRGAHTGERPYACADCGRRFSQSGNLLAHRRRAHGSGGGPAHACAHCDRKFAFACELKKHMQVIHGLTKREIQAQKLQTANASFTCTRCGRVYSFFGHLQSHLEKCKA